MLISSALTIRSMGVINNTKAKDDQEGRTRSLIDELIGWMDCWDCNSFGPTKTSSRSPSSLTNSFGEQGTSHSTKTVPTVKKRRPEVCKIRVTKQCPSKFSTGGSSKSVDRMLSSFQCKKKNDILHVTRQESVPCRCVGTCRALVDSSQLSAAQSTRKLGSLSKLWSHPEPWSAHIRRCTHKHVCLVLMVL